MAEERGKNWSKSHKDTVWLAGAALSATPHTYDDNKIYRVKLSKPAFPAGHHEPLRPGSEVLVSGAVANEISDAIVGAEVVG